MVYNSFAQAMPDRENSTYRHEARTLGGRNIIGYSKKMGFSESADKRKLFVTSMARLIPAFFGDRTDIWQLQVFRRLPEKVNGMYKEVLVATFSSSEWLLQNGFEKDMAIAECCRSIYAGGDSQQVNTLLKSFNDFAFDPQTESYDSLVKKCQHMLQFHERGVVERFFWAVKKQYFNHVDTEKPVDAPAQPAPPAPKRTKQATSLKDLIPAAMS